VRWGVLGGESGGTMRIGDKKYRALYQTVIIDIIFREIFITKVIS
jgi:hypothetical protein